MKKIVSPYNFRPSFWRISLKYFLLFSGFVIGVYAIFFFKNSSESDGKTLWIIDTSLSMTTEDIKDEKGIFSSRLSFAKKKIESSYKNIGGKHALMIYSSEAKLILPFTDKNDIITATIRGITPHIYNSSSSLFLALSLMNLTYQKDPMNVVILSDGENMEKEIQNKIPLYKKNIIFASLGTLAGGPMLEGYDAEGKPRYKQYAGKNAISKRDDIFIEKFSKLYDSQSLVLSPGQDETIEFSHLPSSFGNIFSYQMIVFIFSIFCILTSFLLSPVHIINPHE